jgi:hypothetical protein
MKWYPSKNEQRYKRKRRGGQQGEDETNTKNARITIEPPAG